MNLHSTLFKLIQILELCKRFGKIHLHSTLFKLILNNF